MLPALQQYEVAFRDGGSETRECHAYSIDATGCLTLLRNNGVADIEAPNGRFIPVVCYAAGVWRSVEPKAVDAPVLMMPGATA